jgi:hypothetical protein
MAEMWEALRREVRHAAKHTVAVGVLAACFGAAHASANSAPATFMLTISGRVVADWDYTGAAVPRTVECATATQSQGFRTATFRTRPTFVRFVDGRLQRVDVRGTTGRVKLAGTNTHLQSCAGADDDRQVEYCARTSRSFSNARVTLSSTQADVIALRPFRLSLRRFRCPLEPAEVAATPLGPPPGPVHVSAGTLADDTHAARITLRASAVRTKNYSDPELGFLQWRTAWTLTLVRVSGTAR